GDRDLGLRDLDRTPRLVVGHDDVARNRILARREVAEVDHDRRDGDARAHDAGDGDLEAGLLGDAGRDADRRVQQALRSVWRHGDVQLVLLAGPARDLVLVAGRRDLRL